jgi:hypothetical protein
MASEEQARALGTAIAIIEQLIKTAPKEDQSLATTIAIESAKNFLKAVAPPINL